MENHSTNSMIEVLTPIWQRVLQQSHISVEDNFFDLGGTSLQLIQVHATIASVMHSDLTVIDLFQYPRISALAARLATNGGAAAPDSAAGHKSAGGLLTAEERARRQHAALARARTSLRRNAP